MRLIEHAARTSAEPAGVLTTRERQVLQMLAAGEDTRSIASGLNYSERTVKNVCSSKARSSCSGGTEGRPVNE